MLILSQLMKGDNIFFAKMKGTKYVLNLQNDTNFALVLWVIMAQHDFWVDKKKLKTPRVKWQSLKWLENAVFCKICQAFLFFLLKPQFYSVWVVKAQGCGPSISDCGALYCHLYCQSTFKYLKTGEKAGKRERAKLRKEPRKAL